MTYPSVSKAPAIRRGPDDRMSLNSVSPGEQSDLNHAGSDSNTQPADLESAALPIELPAPNTAQTVQHRIQSGHFRLIL